VSGEDQRSPDARRRIEELIAALNKSPDPNARELVALVLDLHGLALAKLLSIVTAAEGGTTIFEALAADDQVRPLLLLHGLHPEDLDTRVRRAVDRLRPYLGIHGLRLDVVEIAKGTARLRVHPGNGVAPKASLFWTLPSEIEDAIVEAAPDIDEVIIDGLEAPAAIASASPSE